MIAVPEIAQPAVASLLIMLGVYFGVILSALTAACLFYIHRPDRNSRSTTDQPLHLVEPPPRRRASWR